MNGIRHGVRSRLARLLAVIFAFALLATACGSGGGGNGDGDTAASTGDDTASSNDDSDFASADESDDEPEDEGEAIVETIEEEEPETGPVAGGTLRYGLDAEVDGLNPTTSALSPPGLTMANAVFDTLAALSADGVTAVPYLAESFSSSDDFLTWTVTLRPGISFHDGTPLNAEAIVENFNRQLGDLLIGLAVSPFFVDVDEKAVAIDDLTVQFNLGVPNAFFPATLTGQIGFVASPTWLAAAEEDPTLNQARSAPGRSSSRAARRTPSLDLSATTPTGRAKSYSMRSNSCPFPTPTLASTCS